MPLKTLQNKSSLALSFELLLKAESPFGIQQIDGQNCCSAYERHDVLKTHLYYSRKNRTMAKGTAPYPLKGQIF